MTLYGKEAPAVATLGAVEGEVKVLTEASQDPLNAYNGMFLTNGDHLTTYSEGRVTLYFRDGSELRLFPQSHLEVQRVQEQEAEGRHFSYRLYLKEGALWGIFSPQHHTAILKMPEAKVEILGTELRSSTRKGEAWVSLTEGKVKVRNEQSRIRLEAGHYLPAFQPHDRLPGKVRKIPYHLKASTKSPQLKFEEGLPTEKVLLLQLSSRSSREDIQRGGKVYFRSNYSRVVFPTPLHLNSRGFAHVPLVFFPPQPSDAALGGSVYVWAVLDEESGSDTLPGRAHFTLPPLPTTHKVQVDVRTGRASSPP